METLGGREPGELAYHYLAGMTAATTARAIHHARAAGQRALAISAPNEAVRWYSAALNALPPPRDDLEHARLQLDLGIAQRQAADPNYRETLLSTARTAQHNGADDLLVEAAIAVNPGGFSKPRSGRHRKGGGPGVRAHRGRLDHEAGTIARGAVRRADLASGSSPQDRIRR